jgi:hypothetical protein
MLRQEPYSREMIDEKLSRIEEKLDEHGETHRQILEQVLYTNGKVKNITKWLLIIGTATATLLVTKGSDLVDFILKII